MSSISNRKKPAVQIVIQKPWSYLAFVFFRIALVQFKEAK
jgi:hypothetical protein